MSSSATRTSEARRLYNKFRQKSNEISVDEESKIGPCSVKHSQKEKSGRFNDLLDALKFNEGGCHLREVGAPNYCPGRAHGAGRRNDSDLNQRASPRATDSSKTTPRTRLTHSKWSAISIVVRSSMARWISVVQGSLEKPTGKTVVAMLG